jgi:hypothetical protein
MVDFDPAARALFDGARHATDPTPVDEARIRRALAAKIGGGVLLATGAAQGLGAAKTTAGAVAMKGAAVVPLAPFAKVVPIVLAAAIGAAAAAGYEVHRASRTPPTVEAPRATAVSLSATPSVAPSTPVDEIDAPPPARDIEPPRAEPPATPKPVSAGPDHAGAAPSRRALAPEVPEPPSPSLATELGLLSQMHEAWRSGDVNAAARAIADHERRFPRGVLAEERDALKAMLACRNSDAKRAAQYAADFAAAHPGSPHNGRVAAACRDKRD